MKKSLSYYTMLAKRWAWMVILGIVYFCLAHLIGYVRGLVLTGMIMIIFLLMQRLMVA